MYVFCLLLFFRVIFSYYDCPCLKRLKQKQVAGKGSIEINLSYSHTLFKKRLIHVPKTLPEYNFDVCTKKDLVINPDFNPFNHDFLKWAINTIFQSGQTHHSK